MTDLPLPDARFVRATVERRLAARYRAEQRFRLYGVLAVGAATAALLVLVVSVLVSALPALTQYEIDVALVIDESAVDPRGRLAEINAQSELTEAERAEARRAVIRRANFNGLIQDSLREAFPDVQERRSLRELFGLVSAINAAHVSRRVAADPSLIGTRHTFRMPISDDIDLYLKGAFDTQTFEGTGTATVSAEAGDVEISSDRNDFSNLRASLLDLLTGEAQRLDDRAARREADLQRTTDPALAQSHAQEAERLRAQAAAHRDRAASPDAAVVLSQDTPSVLVFINGGVVAARELSSSHIRGEALVALESLEAAGRGEWRVAFALTPERNRRVSDAQIAWAETLRARGQIRRTLNTRLFTSGDSRDPELAGVRGAFVGTLLTMFVTMLLAVPVGVATAIYLEEFAPKNRWTALIEVNINNLAAVPSIVFGLLGLAVFISIFGLSRSAALVGGMVLALRTLPTVIIAARAAMKAVPPSIRSGALAVGASDVQTVFHHVLPLALPGIMTGSIIGLAQAMGESAPLLMIGMVAFIADTPANLSDPATVMPVQIYLWSNAAERAFEARTSAAIIVLLSLVVVLNLVAVYVRRRFERRW